MILEIKNIFFQTKCNTTTALLLLFFLISSSALCVTDDLHKEIIDKSCVDQINRTTIDGNQLILHINGNDPKIITIDMQDFRHLTLRQASFRFTGNIGSSSIASGRETAWSNEQLKEIRGFLKELLIQDEQILNLDNSRSWNRISSGEQRMVMLVLAIIEKPDILILPRDALYLDTERQNIAKQMLKKYLPNALILVIDRYMYNQSNFYDGELPWKSTY